MGPVDEENIGGSAGGGGDRSSGERSWQRGGRGLERGCGGRAARALKACRVSPWTAAGGSWSWRPAYTNAAGRLREVIDYFFPGSERVLATARAISAPFLAA